MEDFDKIHSIMKRFSLEDLKNIGELLSEYKRKAKNDLDANKRLEKYRKKLIDEGYTGDVLESMYYNEMRRFGLITVDELKEKLRELYKHDMEDMIKKRMDETKPDHETPEELEKRKRDVRAYIEYNFF